MKHGSCSWTAAPVLALLAAHGEELPIRHEARPEGAVASVVQEDALGRPSFLVLLSDDQPYDALSCLGHPVVRTPHLDALAARGTLFTHAFVTTPICAASRASILTGRYERSHGFTFTRPPLSDETVDATYPALLRAAGYRVGFVGKLGVSIEDDDRERMFDSFVSGTYPYLPKDDDGHATHLTERNVDRAIEFLRVEDERPFCLSLSFQAPHAEDHNPEQYVWPHAFDGLYDDVPIPPAATSDPAFFDALPAFLRIGLNRERWHWRFDTTEKRERMVRGYFRMLSGVDAGVGRVLAALADTGRAESTVVVFLGDNGYFLGERGYAGKWTMHDRSTRVPMIVVDPRSPDAPRGARSDAFALNIDVAPTLLALAGVDAPDVMQGRSLVDVLRGAADADALRDAVFTEHLWEHPKIPRTEALRTRGWKYIRYLDHAEYEELYDLVNDPLEEKNLATDDAQAERLAEMRERCERAARRAR